METPNWKCEKDLECLFFFAQRMQEILFDYSLDTFKAPALNSSTICFEAIQIINDIEEGKTGIHALDPVLKELIWKLKGDPITKSIIGDNLAVYIDFADFKETKKIRTKIELLHLKLSIDKYVKKCEELLCELIFNNKEKRDIDKIATNYVSSLIQVGYSQGYIYKRVTDFFFRTSKTSEVKNIKNFFSIFTLERQKFNVYFKGSILFKEIKDSAQAFQLIVVDPIDSNAAKIEENVLKKFPLKDNELYIVGIEIKALDSLAARNICYSLINKISRLFVFFHHKEHPKWSEDCFVVDSIGDGIVIREQTSPMKKHRDLMPQKAAKKLIETLKNFTLEKRAFRKFDKAIDLHGLSVENNNTENQLLQNWIALETLLVDYKNESKIDQVISSLIPFLTYQYIENQFQYVLSDILRYKKAEFIKVIRKVDSKSSLIEKFMMAVVLEKNDPILKEIYGILNENPLLRFRVFLFNKYFSTPEKILHYLETHRQKVEWQLKRIYRTRNQIVHAGKSPRFLGILVENTHVYLDTLLATIINFRVHEKQIFTIEHAITEVRIKTDLQISNLRKAKKTSIDENNFKLLFIP